MEIENTRKRFTKRIEFERRIIILVNSVSSLDEPLFGLSDSAILNWEQRSILQYKLELATMLRCLSRELMLFCDNSRNAFDVGKRISSNEMNKQITYLELFLKEKRS